MINSIKVIKGRSKRVGRGHGSGKGGHTTGRGTKGQKARYSLPILFEGVKAKKSMLRRVPFLRGKMKNKSFPKPYTIAIDRIQGLADGSTITFESLISAKLVSSSIAKKRGIKLVGGVIFDKLTVKVPTTKKLKSEIEARGGTVNW